MTNSSGNATDTYTYDAWGKATHTVVSGGTTDNPYQYVGQLGYYTHHQEPKLNPESTAQHKYVMLQLGVRYYVPEMGRFTQRDAERGHGTAYSYCGDSPSAWVDPDGMKKIKVPYPIPPGWVARFKICCRDLNRCLSIRHAYLLIDGNAVGYGPCHGASTGQIRGDIDDIVNGRANCHTVTVDDAAYQKLKKVLRNPRGVPGDWTPGGIGSGGPYIPGLHDCYDWITAALKYAGLDPGLARQHCDQGTRKGDPSNMPD